ncbi:hypothetical protein GCM10007893_22540 [Paracoccus marinus]|nr:hypothetical protein GCM10007893_22540 [Paracoccus marinus]
MAPRSEPKISSSQPVSPFIFSGSPVPVVAAGVPPMRRIGPVLQSAADKINNDDGYLASGLCMRPEAKEHAYEKLTEDANWLSTGVLRVGAGVDDAVCALPHLVEDVWKGHIRPSSDRDPPGTEPGAYYRNSLSATGEGMADLGQLAYEQTSIGMIDRLADGATVIEAKRGKSSMQIVGSIAEELKDDPLRAAGSLLTGGVMGRLARVKRTPVNEPHPRDASAPDSAPLRERKRTDENHQPPGEAQARLRALELDGIEGGHVVSRHGPEVSDEALRARVTTGYAPDGTWNPSRYSGRFNTYRDLLETRDAAFEALRAQGVDLTKAPGFGELVEHPVTLNHGRPIDHGFFAPQGTGKHIVSESPTGKRKAWQEAEPVSGVTGTFTRVAWNQSAQRWQVTQHFPVVKGWSQATQSYPNGLIE